MSESTVRAKLLDLQNELKAPKSQYNSFGKYHYRNCEDILEAVKPLLREHGLSLSISDEITQVGDRIYVKATATVVDAESLESGNVTSTAYAREPKSKKGMDESQITGMASSYARKYALNALFLIDDTKDADSQDNRQKPFQAACTECGMVYTFANAEQLSGACQCQCGNTTFKRV